MKGTLRAAGEGRACGSPLLRQGRMLDKMIPETEFSTIPFLGFFVGAIDTNSFI